MHGTQNIKILSFGVRVQKYAFSSKSVVSEKWDCGTFQRNVLNNTNHDKGLCRAEPVAWAQRSPDVKLSDFPLFVHLKALMYSATTENKQTLHEHIFVPVKLFAAAPAFLTECDCSR